MSNWRHILTHLSIGASVIHEGVAVARLSNTRFIVLKDGMVYETNPRRSTVGLSIARTLELITGESVIAPCADCGQPRTTLSYCDACWSQRTQGYKQSAKVS